MPSARNVSIVRHVAIYQIRKARNLYFSTLAQMPVQTASRSKENDDMYRNNLFGNEN